MTAARWIMPALVAELAMTSCASAPLLDMPVARANSTSLRIVWVASRSDPRGVLITGGVRRVPLSIGPIDGHLHIEGRFADGRPPIVTDAIWTGLPLRGSAPGHFRALLRADRPAEITSVSVEHRYRRDDSLKGA